MEKSANKRWKESGSTLTFKEWIDRENKKNESFSGNFIPFAEEGILKKDTSFKQIIDDTINEAKQDLSDASGYKSTSSSSNVLGLNKNVLVFSTLLIVGSISFYLYSKYKKK